MIKEEVEPFTNDSGEKNHDNVDEWTTIVDEKSVSDDDAKKNAKEEKKVVDVPTTYSREKLNITISIKKGDLETVEDLNLPLKRKLEVDDETPPSKYFKAPKQISTAGYSCPFLDQINRRILDFDNRKLCSVTMSALNVYGCLVCGVYFSGRTRGTPAYKHALHDNHKMFIHLEDSRIFCLPEDYEIKDTTLNDIKHNLHPTFSSSEVNEIDSNVQYAHALDGNDFLPGVLGLNNLTKSCWCNVVVQSLLKVKPLRNFFIKKANYQNLTKSELVLMFGELVRKYHNPRNFKNHISPHELLQAILVRSNKKFEVGVDADPLEFLSWFLRALHEDLGGTKQKKTIISQVFQGQVMFETTEIPKKPFSHKEQKRMPFNYLLLDLPPMPLFKDGQQEKFIPQIPLQSLLSKFDGKEAQIMKDGAKRRMRLTKLPPYLIIAYRRFKDGYFSVEKNTTIVNCVIKGLDLKIYLQKPLEHKPTLEKCSVGQLKKKLILYGGNTEICSEKTDYINAIIDCHRQKYRVVKSKYDLISNVVHDGLYKQGTNKAFAFNEPNQQWYDMHDLHVQETIPQLVSVAESYVQIWRRR